MEKNKYVDFYIAYKGMPLHSEDSKCGVCIRKREDKSVVIFTDMGSIDETYHGTSITNSAEQAIKTVIHSYSIDPANTIFIEHYAKTKDNEETFDQIIYNERQIYWKPLTRKDVDKMLEG